MPKLTIDGKTVAVPEGSMVMHAADEAGTYIPHFCYHKKLTIAANCRMCLVEIEKAPKLQIACNTMCADNMVVKTASAKARARLTRSRYQLLEELNPTPGASFRWGEEESSPSTPEPWESRRSLYGRRKRTNADTLWQQICPWHTPGSVQSKTRC